jgi:hypothetical protein
MIVKSFKTYVPPGNLDLGEVGFSARNNHVLKEKEFK